MKSLPSKLNFLRFSFFLSFTYFLFFSFPVCFATTYILQEDGIEVGKWEEKDGMDKVEVITQTKRKVPEKVKSAVPISGEAGYQWTKPEVPKEKVEKFKLGGRVVDAMNLEPASVREITFSGGGVSISAPVAGDGVFKVELPKLDKGGYEVSFNGLVGYHPAKKFIFVNKSFSGMSQKSRILLCQSFPQWTPIKSAVYQVEIGLCRDMMSPAENSILSQYYAEMAS